MPELPEVETVRRVLERTVLNRIIASIVVRYPAIVKGTSSVFIATLRNQTIQQIERRGKYLIFLLNQSVIVSHLRMEGRYRFYDTQAQFEKDNPYLHLWFEFQDGSILAYEDVRKFGRFQLYTRSNWDQGLIRLPLGREPSEFKNPSDLFDVWAHRSLRLKQALLHQQLMAGIGNIYADEIAFRAQLSPWRKVSSLSLAEVASVLQHAQSILQEAIDQGGTTVRSYHSEDGIDGRFQQNLFVYGREGKPCRLCGTGIVKSVLAGRGTHFCPSCQSPKNLPQGRVLGITGRIGSGKSTVSKMFSEFGFEILDSDQFAREALNLGTPPYLALQKQFPKEVFFTNGEVNRQVLRTMVADNPQRLYELEAIVHPYVIAQTKAALHANPSKWYLLDVPLLFESGMDQLCDWTIVVHTKESIRRQRLKARGTMPLQETKKLTERVLSVSERIKRATLVIDNSLGLEVTRKQVQHIVNRLIPKKEHAEKNTL